MAYSSDGKRSGQTRRSQGRAGESRVPRGTVTSQGSRPARARGGSPSQYRNSRGYQTIGRKSGYDLKPHSIRFNDRRGGLLNEASRNPRLLLTLVLAVVILVVCIFGVTKCVQGVIKGRQAETPANEQDARVAGGISEAMTTQFTAALDRATMMQEIAAHADRVSDERLLTLALTEPTAVEFVAAFASEKGAPTNSERYATDVSRGVYPLLYNWDTRWGYVPFGNSVLGITGSGPTSFAMAYMGLLGKNDKSPADFAAMVTESGATSDAYGATADFFLNKSEGLGLSAREYTPSAENLTDVLDSGVVVMVQLKEGTFGDRGHWALVVDENLDGSVNVYDPTSSGNTEHPWAAASVANSSETFIALSMGESTDEE